jgi:hypothetical protein
MKKLLIFTMVLLAGFSIPGYTQEVDKRLGEARAAYESGNLEAARFALQQALNDIDLAIGQEILAALPDRMGDMGPSEADDQVSSSGMGYVGLFVSRTYQNDGDASVRVQLMGDSPLLAGINTILALPLIAGDSNQKRIRVGGYRALLQKNEGEGGEISYDVQIPFGSSLMTLEFKGISDEGVVTSMAGTIPVDQVSRLISGG